MLLQFHNLKLYTWNYIISVLKKKRIPAGYTICQDEDGTILFIHRSKQDVFPLTVRPSVKQIQPYHLTLSAALNFRFLQVGEADKDGLANILLLLRWRVFHSTTASPGLQQFLQHLNQRTWNGSFLHISNLSETHFWNLFSYSTLYILMALWSSCFPVNFMLPTNRANFVFQGPKHTVWPAENSTPPLFNILSMGGFYLKLQRCLFLINIICKAICIIGKKQYDIIWFCVFSVQSYIAASTSR